MTAVLHFDVSAGASGDMLLGALFQLCPRPEEFLRQINALPLPGIAVRPEPAEDHGLTGIHMSVSFHGQEEQPGQDGHHHHVHRTLEEVLSAIRAFPLPRPVLENACAVYGLIARAEAAAHGCAVGAVHFHEVGMDDAIADVTGVCLLLHQLAPTRITATPIAVGGGQVHCAHGVLPVPAPATAHLLDGLPTVHGPVDSELCTPTGAALLRHFVDSFTDTPPEGCCGRGMGTKRFPTHCNAVTAFLTE